MTVKRYGQKWIEERKRQGLRSAPDDEGRLKLHIYPALGSMVLTEIRLPVMAIMTANTGGG